MFQNKKKVAALAAMAGLVLSGFAAVSPAQATEPTLLVWADENRGPHLKTLFGSLADQTVGEFVTGYKIDVVAFSNFDALKAAVTEQFEPLPHRLGKLNGMLFPNGAFNTTLPPHVFEIVNVPVVGGPCT